MRIVDISVPVTSGMFRFPRPDHVTVSITEEGTYDEVDCRTSRIVMGSHSGTHIDAPMHMYSDGASIDRVPLSDLVGPARVIRVKAGPGSSLDVDSIDPELLDEPRVILDSGWYTRWATEDYYRDFPVLTPGLAKHMVGKGIRCVVVDLPLSLEVHNIILGAGGCQVENVVGLDQIKGDRVTLVALPLKIAGIDAAPARVIVLEE
jgi:arylformamidase